MGELVTPSEPSWDYTTGAWRWCVSRTARDGILSEVEMALAGGAGYSVIRNSRVREVALAELPNHGKVVIKRYLPMKWLRGLWTALRGSQWRREWRTGQLLRELGIPTPEPLVVGERLQLGIPVEGVFLSRAIESGRTFRELLAAEGTNRFLLLNELGRLLARIHGLGVLHMDLHAENILAVDQGEGSPQFWLLDLHRVRIGRSVAPARRQWNLAQLLVSLRGRLAPGGDWVLIDSYLRASGLGGFNHSWSSSIDSMQEKMARKHYKSRTRRCVEDSSGFAVERMKGGRVIRLRSFPLHGVLQVQEEAARTTNSENTKSLKLTDSTRVTQHEIVLEGTTQRLCVKEHRRIGPGSLLLPTPLSSRARRFWVGAWGLMVRGFQVPRPLAMWERRGIWSFSSGVVMEMISDGIGLDRFIAWLWPGVEGRRKFMMELACTLARMHRAGIFHRDLKAGNVLVRCEAGGSCGVLLLDLEDVRFHKKLTRAKMALNLAQLDASISNCVGRFSRLRFLCLYGKGWVKSKDLRWLARKVWRLSQARRGTAA